MASNDYIGDPIVFLENTDHSICLGGNDALAGVTRDCPGGGSDTFGTEEVECFNECTSDFGGGVISGFINVGLTNFEDHPQKINLEHSEGAGNAWNWVPDTSDAGEYNWNYCTTC